MTTSTNEINVAFFEGRTYADLNQIRPVCVAFFVNATSEQRALVAKMPGVGSFWDQIAATATSLALNATAINPDLAFADLIKQQDSYKTLLFMPSLTTLPMGTKDVVNAFSGINLATLKENRRFVIDFFAAIPQKVVDEVVYFTTMNTFMSEPAFGEVIGVLSSNAKAERAAAAAYQSPAPASAPAPAKKVRTGLFKR